MWEIFHRQDPYAGRDPVSVAVEVIKSGLRPIMNPDVSAEMKALITSCWSQEPEMRPSFQTIMNTLRNIGQKNPMYSSGASLRVDAPTGLVYLVNTSIPNAFSLWEQNPVVMLEAMRMLPSFRNS